MHCYCIVYRPSNVHSPLRIGLATLAYEAPARVMWFGVTAASLQNAVFLSVLAASTMT